MKRCILRLEIGSGMTPSTRFRMWLIAVLIASGCAQSGKTIMKNSTAQPVGGDCCMSFRDLFILAKKRDWTAAEAKHFGLVDQPERNRLVKVLATEAGCVCTQDRTGTDGQVYTAFWLDQS